MTLANPGELVRIFAREDGVSARLLRSGKFGWRLIGLSVPGATGFAKRMAHFDPPFVLEARKFERTFGMRVTPMQ